MYSEFTTGLRSSCLYTRVDIPGAFSLVMYCFGTISMLVIFGYFVISSLPVLFVFCLGLRDLELGLSSPFSLVFLVCK